MFLMTLELYRSLAFRGYHHAQRCLLNVLAFTWVNVHSKKIKETVWTFVDKRGVLRVMKLYSARINGSLIKHLLKRNEILGKNILHYAMHVRWHVCPWHKKIKKINAWKGCISPGASVPFWLLTGLCLGSLHQTETLNYDTQECKEVMIF